MSLKLGLGVIQVPEPEGGDTFSTGIQLEKNYSLFSTFYNAHSQEIADLIAKDAEIGLEMMLKGQTVKISKVFAVSSEEITDKMHTFITSQEVEHLAKTNSLAGLIMGNLPIPTQAALDGKSYRFAKGTTAKRWLKGKQMPGGSEYTKRNPRPSFIYSGVFEASLKAEIK